MPVWLYKITEKKETKLYEVKTKTKTESDLIKWSAFFKSRTGQLSMGFEI